DADPSDLETMDGVHDLEAGQGRLRFDVDDATVHDVLPALATMGATNLTITPPSLEDLFLRHYGDDLSVTEDEAAATSGGARGRPRPDPPARPSTATGATPPPPRLSAGWAPRSGCTVASAGGRSSSGHWPCWSWCPPR